MRAWSEFGPRVGSEAVDIGVTAPPVAYLRRSVELNDALPYDEPWGWIQPTSHAPGALLFEQDRTEEAEAVDREDLGLGGKLSRSTIHPDNVWSLKDLVDCLERRKAGETEEARLLKKRRSPARMAALQRVALVLRRQWLRSSTH